MSDRHVVIEAGRGLLGRELTAVENVVVVFRDGLIEAAGPEASIPDDAEVIDARGMTVLPGFIDAHVHIGFFEPAEIAAGGVTTVRDLAWPPASIWPLVEASRRPDWNGPSIVAAGPMLTAPGGYPTRAAWAPSGTGREIRDADDARRAVDEVASQGATIVKIALAPPVGPVLDEATLAVIVDAAHGHGLRVTGHIDGLEELRKALRAGVDELAHMLMSDEHIPDETIAEMVRRVTVVPTLAIRTGPGREIAIENVRRFVAAGGRVVYGTDLGNEGPIPGIDPTEIGAMTAAGMSPIQVIASATVDSADRLGLDSIGAIAPGLRADLIAVPGNPVEDIAVLSEVEMVWRAGRRLR